MMINGATPPPPCRLPLLHNGTMTLWSRPMHEGEQSNWLHKTILQLSHLFQVELLLFSTRAFSKLNFLISLTEHFQTNPNFVSTYNKITIKY